MSTEVGTFELLNILDSRPTDRFDHLKRQENWGKEVSRREFAGFFNADGVMVAEKRFRERVFFGGLTPDARQQVRYESRCPIPVTAVCKAWKYLFGLWKVEWTKKKCENVSQQKQRQYEALRYQWESILPDQVPPVTHTVPSSGEISLRRGALPSGEIESPRSRRMSVGRIARSTSFATNTESHSWH